MNKMTPIRLLWRHALRCHNHIPVARLHYCATLHNNNIKYNNTITEQHNTTKHSTLKLSSNLRQLIKLIHPDLYTQYPLQQTINSNNLSLLLALFSDIKNNKLDEAYPERKHLTLQFYVRCDRIHLNTHSRQYDTITQLRMNALNVAAGKQIAQKLVKNIKNNKGAFTVPADVWSGWYITQPNPQFYLIGITLSLNGGQCKKLVEKAMCVLFALTGLPTQFIWDTDYFIDKQQRILNVNEQGSGYESAEAEHERLMKQQEEIDRRMGYA